MLSLVVRSAKPCLWPKSSCSRSPRQRNRNQNAKLRPKGIEMEETSVKKICGQCSQEKLQTDFGVKSDSSDGRRRICKICYASNRSKKQTPEMKALARLEQIVKDARASLADSATPFSIRHKADQTLRNYEKRKRKLLKPIEEQRKAEEAARQSNNPSLLLVQQTFGSHIFLSTEQMRAKLELARVTLGNLVGPDDGPAVLLVKDYIKNVSFIVKQRDDLEA